MAKAGEGAEFTVDESVEGAPDEVVVNEEGVTDVPEDMEPGPRGQVRDAATGAILQDVDHNIALRRPIQKGPQEGKIGVVDRVLTDRGEEEGIVHGVVAHDVDDGNPGKEPWERCPECGNVNLAYHNKTRTSAHCVHCLWQSSNLKAQPNPADRIPGLHEVDVADEDRTQAGEIPRGKLEGALGMDPQEAKEGVPVEAATIGEVTTFHTGDDGEPIKQNKRFIEPKE